VVARPCEASWLLVLLWFSVWGPFAAWGAQGKKSTPDTDPKTRRSESAQDPSISAPRAQLALQTPLREIINTHSKSWGNFPFSFGIPDFAIFQILWSSALPLRPPKPKFLNTWIFSPCISAFHLSWFQEFQWHATLSLDSRSPKIWFDKILKITFEFYRVSRFWVFPFIMSCPLVNMTPSMLILKIMKMCYSPLLRRSMTVIFLSDPMASAISRTRSSICQSLNSMFSPPSSL